MKMSDSKERYHINSILRACTVLRRLAQPDQPRRIADLAREMGVDRSTVYRIFLSLEECGFAQKDSKTGEYSLGVGVFEVGSAYLRSLNFPTVARQEMIDLSIRVHETVHLAALSGDQAVYLDKIDSPGGLGLISKVGSRVLLHCTGVGKVLLAYQPPARREILLKTIEYIRFTENTITSAAELQAELEAISGRGYGFDRVEHEDDIACVAGPIFDHHGEILAALSVSGAAHRINYPENQPILIQEVLRTTGRISEKMGYLAARKGAG